MGDLLETIKKELLLVNSINEFSKMKKNYLGPNGLLAQKRKYASAVEDHQKKRDLYGEITYLQQKIEVIFQDQLTRIRSNISFPEDTTAIPFRQMGQEHLLQQNKRLLLDILRTMNFTIEDAPEIDDSFFNFTALNIPENHPCRTDHQSFFLENGKILRTQCSNIQNRTLRKKGDIRSATIGRTFRKDHDRTHSPMFHQCEMIVVNSGAHVANLFATIKQVLNAFFEKSVQIRVRSSYFPFTEPSFEVDMRWKNQWLEVMGCGIIHRKVFEFAERTYELGYVVGCGLERLVMIKYDLKDIRLFYSA